MVTGGCILNRFLLRFTRLLRALCFVWSFQYGFQGLVEFCTLHFQNCCRCLLLFCLFPSVDCSSSLLFCGLWGYLNITLSVHSEIDDGERDEGSSWRKRGFCLPILLNLDHSPSWLSLIYPDCHWTVFSWHSEQDYWQLPIFFSAIKTLNFHHPDIFVSSILEPGLVHDVGEEDFKTYFPYEHWPSIIKGHNTNNTDMKPALFQIFPHLKLRSRDFPRKE